MSTKYSPAAKRGHGAANLDAARIILDTRDEHGPALIDWAERVIAQKTADLLGNCAKMEESDGSAAINSAPALSNSRDRSRTDAYKR